MKPQEILRKYKSIVGSFDVDNVDRLEFLLSLVGDGPRETPWYPDNSGEWVEYFPGCLAPDGEVLVEFLTATERKLGRYFKSIDKAADVAWEEAEIVAYKIVS